jgi:4-aminobutyrate aminotransferase-like enzyme
MRREKEGNNLLTTTELQALDERHIIRGWAKVAEPILIAEARGPIVKDTDGREYLDCSSGLFSNNAGHCHPRIVEAIRKQAEILIQPSMRHSNVPAIMMAKRLADLTPGDLSRVYFTTGGGETVETAFKMARHYTKKNEIIALRNAFHGLGYGSIAATSGAKYKAGFGQVMPGIVRGPHAYCYRCPFAPYPSCDLWCAEELGRIIEDKCLESGSCGDIGAIIVEAMQGSGGMLPPDPWLGRVREICDKYGVLMIVDEIQTGFGRTGKMFACETFGGVVPDILCLSKNVGGSLPAGAVVTKPEIAADFNTGTCPTLAGNALAMAAGLALIDVLIEEKLPENAAAMGRYIKDGLENGPAGKYMGEVRAKGLMCGVEAVRDKKTKEPLSKSEINFLLEALLDEGVLTSASGIYGNIFRVQPTLDLNKSHADWILDAFAKAFAKLEAKNLAG